MSQEPHPIGLKLVTRNVIGGIPSFRTEYFQQDRKRTELRNWRGATRWYGASYVRYGPRLATLIRCDLAQSFDLNLDAREYTASPYPSQPLTKEEQEALGIKMPQFVRPEKPTLRIETTTVDTGERKTIFARTARHIITTRKHIPLEGAVSGPQETITDGWYIDLDTSISCEKKLPKGARIHSHLTCMSAGDNRIDNVEFIDNGEQETGFAILTKVTSSHTLTLPDGRQSEHANTSEFQVTELIEGPLDPALFSIPDGFRQVRHIESNPPPSPIPGRWGMAWQQFLYRLPRLFR